MKYIKLVAAASLIMATGCNKLLDIKETDIIAGDVALKTVENCESGLMGAYAVLSMNMDYQFNATMSDEVKDGEFYNSGTVHEWAFGSTDVVIRDTYTAITPMGQLNDRASRVLRALPNADSTRAGDNVLRSKLRGEALFLRAWGHFQLFRYYCNNYTANGLAMPYLETPTIEPLARLDMATYFSKLKADLAEAKNLVPAELTPNTSRTRVNKATVAALQARVALYMKDWTNAEAFATEYINQLPLATTATFPSIWTDASVEEVSFYLIGNANSRLGSIWKPVNSQPTVFPQIVWFASTELWNMYDKVNDVRFNAYFTDEPLLSGATPARNSKLISKYKGSAAYAATTENLTNAKVFRTGEMYLIRAEARAEQDRFTGANSAESDLNQLRANRINGYTPVTLASKAAAITAIMEERFKELAYEGHRFWDLKRRGLPVERIPADAPNTASATLPAGNFRFLLPIPLTEIQANRLMEQNPEY
ncbi:RagB/SusD family nutrient uptake outer membrane protein [Chitinophaga sp. YIM B06452]|uniref:RagB/SusD family nutrient uptake outer membrane protein n=1 Tax=Chitinophaga sp. YIM B06452 TaxID=3082158 RepID=UPI0031FF06EC